MQDDARHEAAEQVKVPVPEPERAPAAHDPGPVAGAVIGLSNVMGNGVVGSMLGGAVPPPPGMGAVAALARSTRRGGTRLATPPPDPVEDALGAGLAKAVVAREPTAGADGRAAG